MAEELQHLIDRIQREAVDTGEQQATKIVAQAREKAAALVKEAEAKSSSIVEKAKADAEQYTQRGQQALAQSARDLLITVGQGVEKIFAGLVRDSISQAMDTATLQALLVKVVDHYLAAGHNAGAIELLLDPSDQAGLTNLLKQRFSDELAKGGLQVTADPRTGKGFKIRLRDQHIEHDFSGEAMAEALAAFLRPALAETVYKVAREQT